MEDSHLEAWLRLANLQLPARLANALLDHFGGPEPLFESSLNDLAAVPEMNSKCAARLADPSYIATDDQRRFLDRPDVRVVARTDPDYPRNLLEIPDAPPVLFVRGALDERDRFAVALVGSRSATPYGQSIALKLGRDLAAAGLTIVSGGAIGIDTAAHKAAVAASGRTLVVLGCGLDIDYPRENRGLFGHIVREGLGAIITEFPVGATPEHWRFPLRNRIVSGLSMGVVVVEAGIHSGALITAGLAGEQGREVMAIPGAVEQETSRGAHALIKDGAALVEDARDVLRVLGVLALEEPAAPDAPRPAQAELPSSQRLLLEQLSLTPKHIDVLAAAVQLPHTQVSVDMTLLELSGMVRRLPGNCYIRVL